MATYGDLKTIQDQMELVKANPNICAWAEQMQITYSVDKKLWIATFDCDLSILFDDVEQESNNIVLTMKGVRVAYFCHMHQRI